MSVKQVIVMRKDLGMRKGKMIAQGAHASVGALLSMFDEYKTKNGFTFYEVGFFKDSVLDEWLYGIFTKICVGVNSEAELLDIYDKVKETNLPVKLITDCGLTEFHNEPTNTCLCIGPAKSEDIDRFTGHLSLL